MKLLHFLKIFRLKWIAILLLTLSNYSLLHGQADNAISRQIFLDGGGEIFRPLSGLLDLKINLTEIENKYFSENDREKKLIVEIDNNYHLPDAELSILFEKSTRDSLITWDTLPFVDTIRRIKHDLFLEDYILFCKNCATGLYYSCFQFIEYKDSLFLLLSDYYLKSNPQNQYYINAYIKSAEDSFVILDNMGLMSNRNKQVVEIKEKIAPTFWNELWGKVFNTQNLLITLLLFLIAVLRNSLIKKIQSFIDWFFDFLGRISIGYFSKRRFIKKYLSHIIFQHKYLNLVGFNTAGISKPLLEDVFISLRVSSFDGNTRVDDFETNGSKVIPFLRAMKRFKKLIILGMPGAGKTTTLSYALLAFARGQAQDIFEIDEKLLPVFIPLRQLSHDDHVPIYEDILNPESTLLPKKLKDECPPNFFKNKLEKGECLVLLDGLDEVTDQRIYKLVANKIDDLVAHFPENYFLITCRIAGWQGLLKSEFSILEAQNFDRDEIQRFVWGWHEAILNKSERDKLKLEIPDEAKFQEQWKVHRKDYVKPAIKKLSEELLDAIYKNPRILSLAQNPMLLSLMALVHFNRAILPKGRTTLYKQCLELLIDAWDRKRDILSVVQVTATDKENILREIAFDFQINGRREDKRENIVAIIEEHYKELKYPASQLLEDIEKRSGILIERQIGIIGFAHLTLQEYLVAIQIYSDPEQYAYLLIEHIDDADWREVILLYAGLIRDVTKLVHDILFENPERSLEAGNIINKNRLILAAHCIGDSNTCEEKIVSFVCSQLIDYLERTKERIILEKIEDAISALAIDYEEQARTIREKLSERLIKELKR